MDKQTLSNYGLLTVVTLILAVMLAFATPFGQYVGDGVVSVANGLVGTSNNAVDEENISKLEKQWESKLNNNINNGGNNNVSGNIDLSTVDTTLENNSWETIQKVVKAGKVAEAGWSVGNTKTLTINGATKTATLIGINHDGANTATFMVNSICSHAMNPTATNAGGWKDSKMRDWLNSDIYNSMTDVKNYIKEVDKYTNNIGYQGNTATATSDKVFLLSVKEVGLQSYPVDNSWGYPYIDALNAEGTTYEWFNNNTIDTSFWLRSPRSDVDNCFFLYDYGYLLGSIAHLEYTVCPAFVIG